MNDCRAVQTQEKQTLIQAFEKLTERYVQLKEVAIMTEKLNQKLNRTEGHLMCADKKPRPQNEDTVKRNIVEMFNFIADKMEKQIIIIGNNTEYAMKMIE